MLVYVHVYFDVNKTIFFSPALPRLVSLFIAVVGTFALFYMAESLNIIERIPEQRKKRKAA